jgi:hypothetical protein
MFREFELLLTSCFVLKHNKSEVEVIGGSLHDDLVLADGRKDGVKVHVGAASRKVSDVDCSLEVYFKLSFLLEGNLCSGLRLGAFHDGWRVCNFKL